MSVPIKRRQSAKVKKRARKQRHRPAAASAREGAKEVPASELFATLPDTAVVALGVDLLAATPEYAERFAAALLTRAEGRVEGFADAVADIAANLIDRLTHNGWTPAGLCHVVRHREDAALEAVVVGLLCDQAEANEFEDDEPEWQGQLDVLVAPAEPDLTTVDGLAEVLRVLAALAPLPPVRDRVGPTCSAVVQMSSSSE